MDVWISLQGTSLYQRLPQGLIQRGFRWMDVLFRISYACIFSMQASWYSWTHCIALKLHTACISNGNDRTSGHSKFFSTIGMIFERDSKAVLIWIWKTNMIWEFLIRFIIPPSAPSLYNRRRQYRDPVISVSKSK